MSSRQENALAGADIPDDVTIQSHVRDAIAWENRLRGTRIGVRVVNTEVTLEGWVNTEDQERIAGERASAVFGVGRVVNNLVIRGRGSGEEG